ncbi:amino acid ABC transporter substrate-binding protein [Curvibacter sp. APW13]|uniref:amino acid ABC transporter substrate-binding protein n=1 Tax=Curvibacter sp. APW13 TaxID=3077236 RepID=UPI0028DEBF6A|nr:amino acid ABC transporter substrate-binding protein [Curvibacter sp. APW13]MDT8991081.1 amino acid ABC transporter substrate-binding protein [Curvibacter sp. APW13]
MHTFAAPRTRRFLTLALCLAAGFLPCLSWAGPVLDRIRANGEITLAHRESSVPFSYVDKESLKPVGYALDICRRLAEAVSRQLALPKLNTRYLLVTPANRMAVIEEGQADLECGSTTNNAERREKVAFTIPHYITGARFLVQADMPATQISDFRGKRVVSTKGTTPLKAIIRANTDHLLGMQILEAPDHAKAVEMVERGEADAFVMDDVLLYGLASARPDPSKLKVVGKFLTIEPLAIVLNKNDPEFKRIVDNEMKRLIVSREAHALYERWFMQPIPPHSKPLNLPMNFLLRDFWKYPTDQVPG